MSRGFSWGEYGEAVQDYGRDHSDGTACVGAIFSNVEIWGKIFQVLEAEDQQTPMMFPEVIKRAKGEGVKADKSVIPLIDAAPKYLSFNKKGYTMEWLRKWHRHDPQENEQLQKDQEFIMGDVLDLQASIGRVGRNTRGEY